jgi:hypothetical protein
MLDRQKMSYFELKTTYFSVPIMEIRSFCCIDYKSYMPLMIQLDNKGAKEKIQSGKLFQKHAFIFLSDMNGE